MEDGRAVRVTGDKSAPMYEGYTCVKRRALASPPMFDAGSVDMIGKHVARALHGQWLAPSQAFDDPDVSLIFGANPLVSHIGGVPLGNPGKWLTTWLDNGLT